MTFSYSSTVKETDYQAAEQEAWRKAVGRISLIVLMWNNQYAYG